MMNTCVFRKSRPKLRAPCPWQSCILGFESEPNMKTPIFRSLLHKAGWIWVLCLGPAGGFAQGIPEPSFIMYGAVRDGPVRLTVGTMTWQFQSGNRTLVIS